MQAAHTFFAGLAAGALLPLLAAALVASGVALDAGLDVGALAGALDGEDDTVLAGDAFAALMVAAGLDDGAFGELTAAAFFFSSGCGAMRYLWLLTVTAQPAWHAGVPKSPVAPHFPLLHATPGGPGHALACPDP